MEPLPQKLNLISLGAKAAKGKHEESSKDDPLFSTCPLAKHFTLQMPDKMLPDTDVKRNNAPNFGGKLFWKQGDQKFVIKLSVIATTELFKLMNDPNWFKATVIQQPREGFQICTAESETPQLLLNWALCNEAATYHLNEGGGTAKYDISTSIAFHNTIHFGELPHTIRHLARGGKAFIVGDDRVNLKACFSFFDLTETGLVIYRNEATSKSLTKVNHTDLHFAQMPDSPVEFVQQVMAESQIPELIRQSEGYDDIKKEVTSRLEGRKYDAIHWHRYIKPTKEEVEKMSGTKNREVAKEELTGCGLGGTKALQNKLKTTIKILDLGDPHPDLKGTDTLCGIHMTDSKGKRRPMLEQIQVLCAVVELSDAKLIVSERAGLADLVALVGGIPECQFVGQSVREGNERLNQTWMSGAGMSFCVLPWKGKEKSSAKKDKIVLDSVSSGAEQSMIAHEQIKSELNKIKPHLH